MLPPEMQEKQPTETNPPAHPRSPGGGRRRGRGHGPRRAAPAATAGETAAPVGEMAAPAAPVSEQAIQAELPAKPIEPPIRLQEMPVRPAPSKHKIQPPAPHAPPVPATIPAVRAAKPEGSVIGRTVEEVRHIVESLEQALEQMVEVLRLVELAEHQKFADERELESLRRALHKLQPPHRERREHGG